MKSTYSDCWANYRADCDRGMSREHLLSKALFPDQIVYVSGFDWCKDVEKRVGINALQRKILCEKHNNDLGPTDSAAKDAIHAFSVGHSEGPLNGLMLERWLLKTAINLSIGSHFHIGHGMSESKPGWQSPYLLAVAFGDQIFSSKMGAYFLFPAYPYAHLAGEILVVAVHRDEKIGGFVFGLRGQFLFLSLFPGHPPPPIHTLVPGLLPESIAPAQLRYRPEAFNLQVESGPSNTLRIQWSHA